MRHAVQRRSRAVAYRFGSRNRRRKARFATRFGHRQGARTVLLIGVSGEPNPVNNLIEHELVRAFPFVVASEELASGWDVAVVAGGRALHFRDGGFDLVYANAAIEHVGGAAEQQRLVAEMARVGRSWIVTTPNRWLPVEAHFHSFFSHRLTGWAPTGTATRLLGTRTLRALLPAGSRTRGTPRRVAHVDGVRQGRPRGGGQAHRTRPSLQGLRRGTGSRTTRGR